MKTPHERSKGLVGRRRGGNRWANISLEARFWAHVRKTDGCWEWTATCSTTGYGRVHAWGRAEQAHRVAYRLMVGEIPAGLTIDHLCRNRKCVKPEHLEVVTMRENILRGEGASAKNAKRTACIQGHPFTEDNLYQRRGVRICQICKLAHDAAYRTRRRAQRDAFRQVNGFVSKNARRTHCIQGHAFDAGNSYVNPSGKRRCRICRYLSVRNYREKTRERHAYAS